MITILTFDTINAFRTGRRDDDETKIPGYYSRPDDDSLNPPSRSKF